MPSLEIDATGLGLVEVNQKVRKAVKKGMRVIIKNAKHVDGLLAGLIKGEVEVEGDVGDYTAMLIGMREQKEEGFSGPRIVIHGNAGNYLADGAWAGEVVVEGDVGYGAAIYAYGGTVVIHGSAGDALGQLLKGATVIVRGDVGDVVGLYMVGGTIIVVGDAGEKIGDWMIRGEIFIGGSYKSLGSNVKERALSPEDKKRLKMLLSKYGIEADIGKFRKIVPMTSRPFYGKS